MAFTSTLLPATGSPRAVVLLVHGLNLQPDCMLPLAAALQGMGMTVLNLALTGHGANYQARPGLTATAARMASYRAVTHAQWQADLWQGYVQASTLAETAALPCCFVGFSLGALLGCELLATNQVVNFARMVLLAPALVLHPYTQFPRLFKAWPQLTIRSLAPQAYRANLATPIAAYLALGQALDNLHHNLSPRLNIPTQLFVARRDELVAAKGLARFVQQAALTQWQFDFVHKAGSGVEQRYQHLIINPASVGAQEWARMMVRVEATLLG